MQTSRYTTLIKCENKPVHEVGDRSVAASEAAMGPCCGVVEMRRRQCEALNLCTLGRVNIRSGDLHGVADFGRGAAVSGLRGLSHTSEDHGVSCRWRHGIRHRCRSGVV
ncbi:hypothetical protein NDU88_000618 [Pleurodeles waltl]|uniref:Uncharacterized protein n=1 Tax=Pleurodeles waltl TaxID=8319 RepID=A0AAV7UQJ1_PLEWA|nr:hypothetical protein NDU88_000618 [Pleurodeles waltl]